MIHNLLTLDVHFKLRPKLLRRRYLMHFFTSSSCLLYFCIFFAFLRSPLTFRNCCCAFLCYDILYRSLFIKKCRRRSVTDCQMSDNTGWLWHCFANRSEFLERLIIVSVNLSIRHPAHCCVFSVLELSLSCVRLLLIIAQAQNSVSHCITASAHAYTVKYVRCSNALGGVSTAIWRLYLGCISNFCGKGSV